jgi:regulation of enolase protein 1 (concanavalin A-like superfamily)
LLTPLAAVPMRLEWAADPLWLRVSRLGPSWAFHASTDGAHWQFVRHFALNAEADAPSVRVGFEVQSPIGEGCAVTFDQVHFVAERLADLRGGD